jgi:uncharacterized membrane protein YhfC
MDSLSVTHFLNAFLMIAMPIGLAVFLTRRWKLGWRIWWIGAATFVFSQVGHIPFNVLMSKVLDNTSMVYWPPLAQTIFNAAFLGLSAGLFEEGARYLVLRFWAKDAHSWRRGLLFGAGHGGAEAIILGVLVLYSFIQMVALRNTDLSTVVPAGQLDLARQQVAAYWSAPWYATLLGALERFFTIPIQIAMALLVTQAFTRKNIGWLFAAIGYHAVVDASAVLLVKYVGTYWLEAIVGGFAIVSVIVIFLLRQPEPPADPRPVPALPAAPFIPKSVEETVENLDKTRYQ